MPERAVILLVEDQEADVFLIKKAFETARIVNPLFVVRNGEDAISYLQGAGKYANRVEFPLPDLLLLDLKMPGLDGFDVLRWLREQPALKSLRILVLTSSDAIRDVNLAYALGANSFFVKPMDFENTVAMAQVLTTYWLHTDRAPEISREPKSRPEKPGSDEPAVAPPRPGKVR